ncbi:Cytochrome c551 peroxidase precursor [Roseivivax jejudonensis]|uniref:Cytochrome c551 peroxidase n=1 Tax=Roseivivax jejudonensis TaxID=1529041 RepID=A0A1X6Z3S8_9RHOB|nr:cytochrome c peroxidase [Roseivivax jejudonensis]SLN40056.1 Cytochrome c551 peroxidase precursor [Roseivivax jejudonensis]
MVRKTLAGAIPLAICATLAGAAPDLPAPLTEADFPPVDADEAALGRLLFWDPILSGNRNISCGTCHHPRFATGDGLSLGLGEGGQGLGPDRVSDPDNPPEQLIPRNAPPLFNMSARQVTAMFADGRIEVDPDKPSGLRTPMAEEMVAGFDSLLSAQTMFPVLSQDEMAGHYSENEVAQAVRQGFITGPDGAWDLLSRRVAAIPDYQARFAAVYPEIAAGRPIGFTDISNAIAAFVAEEWRSDTAPFDAVLRGEATLQGAAARGAALFYGDAGCAACHSGPLLSDFDFHAMGQPQLGPGKAARFERHARDEGRMRVTGRPDDAYAFRTPPLRNVAETGPWGHAGAYPDLGAFVAQHVDPTGTGTYARRVILPETPLADAVWRVLDDPEETAAIAAAASAGRPLDPAQIDDILAFLDTLTDPQALEGRLGIPETVPSGLPVDR